MKVCDNISQKELERTKAQLRSSLFMSNESNSASCEHIANQTLIFKRPIEFREILQKIDDATIADVQKLARKVFSSAAAVATVGKNDASCVVQALQSHGIR
jgi:predicted Zn-dependent peptidase